MAEVCTINRRESKVKRFFANKINMLQAPKAKSEVIQGVTPQRQRSYVVTRTRARKGKFHAKQTSETQKQRNAKQREKAPMQLAMQRDCSVTVVAKQRKATSRCREHKALVQHNRKTISYQKGMTY